MTQNIVLIGMPCSGKTTIGRMLARRLDRKFIDTDEEIVRHIGMPVTEMFRFYGEPYFRELEAQTVREAAKDADGRVISTGGGAILRGDSVAALRHTGRLIFLDRPLENLIPLGDRPTADSVEKINTLYHERYPIYRSAADLRISASGTLEEVLSEVVSCLAHDGHHIF